MDITTYALCKKIAESSGGGLPPVSESDNGKIATVAGGAWTAQQKKFVVTLTPTDEDFSGTMDKTPQEITAAYNAGQKIVFDIPAMGARVDADQYIADQGIIKCGAKVFYDVSNTPVLITIATNGAADTQTYATQIFTLTPAT